MSGGPGETRSQAKWMRNLWALRGAWIEGEVRAEECWMLDDGGLHKAKQSRRRWIFVEVGQGCLAGAKSTLPSIGVMDDETQQSEVCQRSR